MIGSQDPDLQVAALRRPQRQRRTGVREEGLGASGTTARQARDAHDFIAREI